MTILIDLSVAGVNTGPFNLYSDADGYTSAFATNITRQQLLDGYPAVVAAGTTNIKLQSLSDICPNDTILPVNATTSTTTTLNCSFIVNAQEVTTTTTTSTTTAPTANLTYVNDVSSQPQCDSSVLVTISPNVNTLVTITSSFAPGGGALYLAGLPIEAGVTNIYSNLSNDVVNAGTTKKYRYGIAAGAGSTYTSSITIVVKNASTNAIIATHVFTRTHDGTQC